MVTMMLSKCLAVVVCLVISITLLTSSVVWAGADQDYEKAKESLNEFKQAKRLHKYRDKWQKQIKRFERIVERYPKHSRACDSLYNLGKLYQGLADVSYLKSDRKLAAERFEKLAKQCPRSSLADDGLYHAATIYVRIGESSEAKRVLRHCVKAYPNGDMNSSASDLLHELGDDWGDAKASKDQPKAPEVLKEESGGVRVIMADPGPAILKGASIASQADHTQLQLSFSKLAAMTQGEIPAVGEKPRRLFFDFSNTRLNQDVQTEWSLTDARVLGVRVAQFNQDTVRVVFELSAIAGGFGLSNSLSPPMTIISIKTKGGSATVPVPVAQAKKEEVPPKNTVVVSQKLQDKEPNDQTQIAENASDKDKKEKKSAIESVEQLIDTAPARKKDSLAPFEVKTIVIDPGHGGDDTGAIGRKGTHEKDIVLAISKKLKRILEKEQGLKVVLTRTGDKSMELLDRTRIANDINADLFLSIHCNANRKRKFSGIETFYLNNSSDSYSSRLADRENKSAGKEISDLEFILTDLSMNANITDSIMLANLVQKSLVKQIKKKHSKVVDRGVRRAVFHVLLYARMPAVLVETSFISNPTEELRLRSSAYQEQIAQGIARGVRLYSDKMKALAKHP